MSSENTLAITGVAGTARPRIFQRWWLKAVPPLTVYSTRHLPGWGMIVPWWAWPFELLHRIIFGKATLRGHGYGSRPCINCGSPYSSDGICAGCGWLMNFVRTQ